MSTIELSNAQQKRLDVAQIIAHLRDLEPEDQVTVITLVLELVAAQRRALPATVQ